MIFVDQDVAGFGEISISYLKENLGISNFGVLTPNDTYGLGFQQVCQPFIAFYLSCCDFHHSPSHLLASKSILKATEEYGMESVSSPYLTTLRSKQEVEDEIRKALTVLKESEYNYFVAAFYPEMLGTIMGIAYDMGLAGPGKFWLMSGTADTSPFILSGKFVVEKGRFLILRPPPCITTIYFF